MNTLRYYFEDGSYSILESSCLVHIQKNEGGEDEWVWVTESLDSEDRGEIVRVAYNTEDISSAVSTKVRHKWQSWLAASIVGKYLNKKGDYLEYTLMREGHQSRNIFVVSLMRYLEEWPTYVITITQLARWQRQDPLLYLLSPPLLAGDQRFSHGHTMCHPFNIWAGTLAPEGAGWNMIREILLDSDQYPQADRLVNKWWGGNKWKPEEVKINQRKPWEVYTCKS